MQIIYTQSKLTAALRTPCWPLQIALGSVMPNIYFITQGFPGVPYFITGIWVVAAGVVFPSSSLSLCAIKENGIFFLGTFLTRLTCALCMRFPRFLSCINNDTAYRLLSTTATVGVNG